jgi:hypothetical protein
MSGHLERRVAKLEAVGGAKEIVLVWGGGLTDEEAIASRFPGGVPASVDLVLLRRMTEDMARARGTADVPGHPSS